MSESTKGETDPDTGFSFDVVKDRYPVIAVVFAVAFMLFIRLRHYHRFVQDDRVTFRGQDPWYHVRETEYAVENWPWTLAYDPFTRFPYGADVGQFGTLYDQIVATTAIIIGLGSPSETTVRLVLLVSPAIFGVLTAIPVYYLGKRIANRRVGAMAAVILALLPGEFLARSVVGFADHHAAEVFFQATAVLALVVALQVANREEPVYEHLIDRDWDGVKESALWSFLAGVAIGLYVWTWPPGIVLIGIFGIFALLWMMNEGRLGETAETEAFVTAISMGVATVLILLRIDTFGTSTTNVSLVHVLMPAGVAIGSLLVAATARVWKAKGIDPRGFPIAVAAACLGAFGLLSVLIPSVYRNIVGNIDRVFNPFGDGTRLTIGEAQPITAVTSAEHGVGITDILLSEYGLMFHVAVIGVAYLLFLDERRRPDFWFVAVWVILTAVMAFAQVRFHYYLAVPVALMAAYAFDILLNAVNLDSFPTRSEIEAKQVFGIGIIILLIAPALFIPVPVMDIQTGQTTAGTAVHTADGASQPGEIVYWHETLDWLKEDTPAPGTLGGADNEMQFHGEYEHPADDNYEYPDGAYGVMSWWDYGHFITAEAERIPYSNPFQHGASESANFLLAPGEEEAERSLDSVGDGDEEMRYVVVDWQMVHPTAKLQPQTEHYDGNLEYTDLVQPVESPEGATVPVNDQRYYESMSVRLYHFHGSAVQAQPLVTQWDTETGTDGQPQHTIGEDGLVSVYNTMEEAEEHASEDPDAQIGGVGHFPEEDIEALEHYRLVEQSSATAMSDPTFQQMLMAELGMTGMEPQMLYHTEPSWTKVFERVPGATVKGEAEPDTTVRAAVQVQPANGEPFVYQQFAETDSNGEFEMTLPYSTTGYDDWGTDDGYTDVNVEATGPYTFDVVGTDSSTTAQVDEAQVIGEDSSPVTVEIEPGVDEGEDIDDAETGGETVDEEGAEDSSNAPS